MSDPRTSLDPSPNPQRPSTCRHGCVLLFGQPAPDKLAAAHSLARLSAKTSACNNLKCVGTYYPGNFSRCELLTRLTHKEVAVLSHLKVQVKVTYGTRCFLRFLLFFSNPNSRVTNAYPDTWRVAVFTHLKVQVKVTSSISMDLALLTAIMLIRLKLVP